MRPNLKGEGARPIIRMPKGLRQAEREVLAQLRIIASGGGDSKSTNGQVGACNSVLAHFRWYVDRALTPELAFLAMFGGDPDAANRWVHAHWPEMRAKYGCGEPEEVQ